MKKIVISLLSVLLLVGCGSKKEEIKEEVKEEETVDYTGTWVAVEYVDAKGNEYTRENNNQIPWDNYYFILVSDDTCYLKMKDNESTGVWGSTSNGIILINSKFEYDGQYLFYTENTEAIYFEKSSEDEEIPTTLVTTEEKKEDAKVEPKPVEEPKEEKPVEQPSEPVVEEKQEEVVENTSSGLRPEFKAAMDSYEQFYDDYVVFMQEYQKNPTDLALLSKYTTMISDLEEMDKTFEAWEDEDLNNEELAYYTEVTLRIEQKLLKALQ